MQIPKYANEFGYSQYLRICIIRIHPVKLFRTALADLTG